MSTDTGLVPPHPFIIDPDQHAPAAADAGAVPRRGCLGGLIGWLVASGAALWLAGASLWLLGDGPAQGPRVVGAIAVGCAWLLGHARRLRWLWFLLFIATGVTASVANDAVARADRAWVAAQARQTTAVRVGDHIVLHDVRDFRYPQGEDEPEERWKDVELDLADVIGVDFVLVPIGTGPHIAHVLLSFELADGRFISASPEARYELGETYSPIRGMFRQYELTWVIGTETDVVGVRTNVRYNDVYVYRLQIEPETAQRTFVEVMNRANMLVVEPAWYNSLNTSCSSVLVDVYESTSGESVPFDYRAILSGHGDAFVADLGLLGDATAEDIPAMRPAALVSPLARQLPLDANWSRAIRGR